MGLPGSPEVLRTRVAAPSVCFGPWCGPRILLAAAPTAPPCFRHWRRSSPLLPKGEALASRATSYWTLEAQYGAKKRASLQRAAASGQRTLSSCRCPGQRSTPVPETSCFASFSGNLTDMPKPPLDRGRRGFAHGRVEARQKNDKYQKLPNDKSKHFLTKIHGFSPFDRANRLQ